MNGLTYHIDVIEFPEEYRASCREFPGVQVPGKNLEELFLTLADALENAIMIAAEAKEEFPTPQTSSCCGAEILVHYTGGEHFVAGEYDNDIEVHATCSKCHKELDPDEEFKRGKDTACAELYPELP